MGSAKRLGQLLLEQQEPFAIDVYLHERGYSKRPSNSETKFRNGGSDTSLKFLKKSAKYSMNKKKKVIPSCSDVFNAVFNKFLLSTNTSSDISLIKTGKNSRKLAVAVAVAVEERMYSAGRLNSCSESQTTSPQHKQQISKYVDTERKFGRGCMEDNKQQLCHISVSEKTFSKQYSKIYNDNAEKPNMKKTRKIGRSTVVCSMDTNMKKANETIFSVTLSKLLEQSSTEKSINHNFSADYIKIKLALRETKQLLFDSVREIIETYRWKKGKQRQQVKEILGAEEIGKILHDNVIEWSKQTTHGTNTRRLLNIDLMASFKEWDNLQQQRKEIAMAIEDLISENLIIEIVAEMVSRPQLGST